jgi:LacI family transcriptional regulator
MVTIKMVAERAGVSASTVSRTLSGKIPVDESTRENVMKAVKELDYYPNALAKGLKEGKTNTIALIIPNIQNQIFPIIAKGVEDIARKNGFTLILCNTDEDINIELDYIDKLRKRWIDGFIFATALPESEHILKLRKSGFPVVLIARVMGQEVDAVTVDNFKASFDAVNYLIKTGHRSIAIINGLLETSIYKGRFEGYKAALEQAGIEFRKELVIQGDSIDNGLYSMIYSVLKKGIKLDAIYATSDPKAIIAMKAIKDFGMKIPEDISVVGFDNMEMSMFVDPPLTTISQPLYDMGTLAAKKLIAMIKRDQQEEPIIDILPTELIVRKSSK